MPRGPNGEYRPADPVGCAVMVAKIATGELEDDGRPWKPPAHAKRPPAAPADQPTDQEPDRPA